MNWNSYGNCKELFWISPQILVFIDTMTNYIWVYNVETHQPLLIFQGLAKLKKIFRF